MATIDVFMGSNKQCTDEPAPEVAAAGHDRTIINIEPEYIDAWLNPDPGNL